MCNADGAARVTYSPFGIPINYHNSNDVNCTGLGSSVGSTIMPSIHKIMSLRPKQNVCVAFKEFIPYLCTYNPDPAGF